MATLATFPSGSKSISVEISTPATSGKYPAVIVVYGTDGLSDVHGFGTALRGFAARLASEGFVALIPDYFGSTGTTPGADSVWRSPISSLDTWVQTLADAASFADGRSDVETGKLGIVGFSLGGNLALRLAKLSSASPKALAVVDFFAPISLTFGIGGNVDKLPFVQIHHGDDDHVVPPSQSTELMKLLDDAHKMKDRDYFFYSYAGEGHGFQDPKNIKLSTDRTVQFLRDHLV
jgi:carboxymethylenebutenolidase